MIKKILIIYVDDGLANSQREKQTRFFLEKAGFRVDSLDANLYLKKIYQQRGKLALTKWLNYHLRSLESFYYFWFSSPFRKFKLFYELNEQGYELSKHKKFKKSQAIICQSPHVIASALFSDKDQFFICDLPTSLSEELKFAKRKVSSAELGQIRKLEQKIYLNSDALTFHWHSIQKFIKQLFLLPAKKIIQSGWGVKEKKHQAIFSTSPKIVFLGNLDDYWFNKQLLFHLIQNSQFVIDLYGKTTDPEIKKLKNYKGYLADLDQLADYQFGLITLSGDELRRKSFSAKHLQYFSYGLPVLLPEWRQDSTLEGGTIYYNADNFDQQVSAHLSYEKWSKKSQAGLEVSKQFTWEKVFKEMIKVLQQQ